MPVNREPHIYQGYVISQISKNAGEQEEMEYGVAQSCVASGTHRWADEETDLPNHVLALISDREQKKAEEDAANAAHNAILRAAREKAEGEASKLGMTAAGKPINDFFVTIDDKVFLIRPLPGTALFVGENSEDYPFGMARADDVISITADNALADYKVVGQTDDATIAELLSHESPDVDIPDDWRDKAALQLTAWAKKIRNTKVSMKADAARAILEEWTKTDDQVSVDAPPSGEGKEIPDTENRNKSDVTLDKDGKPILSAEERAQEAARQGLDKDDDDFF